MVCVARPRKVQQEERPVHPVKGKVQEKKRRLRRVEESETVHMVRPQETQQGEWRRSLWEDLRKRAKWYYGLIVL